MFIHRKASQLFRFLFPLINELFSLHPTAAQPAHIHTLPRVPDHARTHKGVKHAELIESEDRWELMRHLFILLGDGREVCACVGACALIMCLFLDYTHTHTQLTAHEVPLPSSGAPKWVFSLLSVWESANKSLQGQTTLATLSLSQWFWTCWLDKGFSTSLGS